MAGSEPAPAPAPAVAWSPSENGCGGGDGAPTVPATAPFTAGPDPTEEIATSTSIAAIPLPCASATGPVATPPSTVPGATPGTVPGGKTVAAAGGIGGEAAHGIDATDGGCGGASMAAREVDGGWDAGHGEATDGGGTCADVGIAGGSGGGGGGGGGGDGDGGCWGGSDAEADPSSRGRSFGRVVGSRWTCEDFPRHVKDIVVRVLQREHDQEDPRTACYQGNRGGGFSCYSRTTGVLPSCDCAREWIGRHAATTRDLPPRAKGKSRGDMDKQKVEK